VVRELTLLRVSVFISMIFPKEVTNSYITIVAFFCQSNKSNFHHAND
jgi:hypothetical protein